MIRRQRKTREIPFSFDSFLDVVANVVGIIIRLILVVWVGARSYNSVQTEVVKPAELAAHAKATDTPVVELKDPLELELAQHRQELAKIQARLLEELKDLQQSKESAQQVEGQLTSLSSRAKGLDQEHAGVERKVSDQELARQRVELSVEELRQRRRKLTEEILAVEKLPSLKQVLRYRTPVSRPVQTEEFFFECSQGRIAFVDIASLIAEVRRGMDAKVQALHYQWDVSDVTQSVGSFRLRYTLERERGVFDSVVSGPPDGNTNFSYGLAEGIVEPMAPVRGETLNQALTPGSQFRQVVDSIDPKLSAVTFWVYPDSFTIYRQLRDYLYQREIVVAGRPLPTGVPITCSRHGSRSRGQ